MKTNFRFTFRPAFFLIMLLLSFPSIHGCDRGSSDSDDYSNDDIDGDDDSEDNDSNDNRAIDNKLINFCLNVSDDWHCELISYFDTLYTFS